VSSFARPPDSIGIDRGRASAGFGHDEREDAVLERGGHGVRVDAGGQAHRALEAADPALEVGVLRALGRVVAAALAAHDEGVGDDLDRDVVGSEARDVEGEDDVGATHCQVGRWDEGEAAQRWTNQRRKRSERIEGQHASSPPFGA
jgi:hypothetical protein